MYVNWLNRSCDVHGRDQGRRPSFAGIPDVLDANDPAIGHITELLLEARDSGAELSTATVAEAVRAGRERHAAVEAAVPRSAERIAPAFESIVYYLARGPLVKIGTTRQPETRFAALMPDRILAVEPGDPDVERQRHLQFKRLRHGTSEYFDQGDDLMTHIQAVRTTYGAPNPSWPSVETIDRPRPDFHIPPPTSASPELVTASEGADLLGVRRNTVSGWVFRKRLRPVGKNEVGRTVYFLDDMKFLAGRSAAMMEARVVTRT